MKVHVKKNDQVVVISGPEASRASRARCSPSIPKDGRVMVEGVAYVSKHQKSRRQGQPGGIYPEGSARWTPPT